LVLFRLVGSAFIGYMMTHQLVPKSMLALLSEEQWIERYVDMLLNGLVDISNAEQEDKGNVP